MPSLRNNEERGGPSKDVASMFEDTSLWLKKVFKDLKYYKKTLRVLSYTNIIIKALLTLNDKTPKIFFIIISL